MNFNLEPDRAVPDSVRAGIAAELAQFYSELSGLRSDAPAFSIARVLRAHAERRAHTLDGREREVLGAAAAFLGQEFDSHRNWVPLVALRALSTTLGAKGGYLSGTNVLSPVDVLRPWSVVASAGAMMLNGLTDEALLPRVATSTTATWIGENASASSETPPSLGNVSLTPKTAVAFIKFSIQLLKQGAAVEEFIRAQLLSAVGEVLDKVYFAGAGGVEPLGLLKTPGIGTASGASYQYQKALDARAAVLDAGAREFALQWVGTPTVQKKLATVQRFTSTDTPVWGENGVLGLPAHATKTAPTDALVCGDFASSVVGVWGPGIRIDVDPSQDFNSGGLVARVMLMCDVAFPRPEAFHVSTGVS